MTKDRRKIAIVGAGIATPGHLTIESIRVLTSSTQIYTNLYGPTLANLPGDIRRKCIPTQDIFKSRGHLSPSGLANLIYSGCEAGGSVAWLTAGHPNICDSVASCLRNEVTGNDDTVTNVPGISSVDALMCDLNAEMGDGLAIYNAPAVAHRRVALDRGISCYILQAGSLDQHSIALLDSHLAEMYLPDHRCAIVRSSSYIDARAVVNWITISQLKTSLASDTLGCTLFIPRCAAASAEM